MVVEAAHVATDDVRNLRPPGLDAALPQRLAHSANVPEQAALGQQRDHQRQLRHPAERHVAEEARSRLAGRDREQAHKQDEKDPPPPPVGFRPILPVELAVEQADEPADQPDRMRQLRERPARLAEQRLQRQRREQQQQVERKLGEPGLQQRHEPDCRSRRAGRQSIRTDSP